MHASLIFSKSYCRAALLCGALFGLPSAFADGNELPPLPVPGEWTMALMPQASYGTYSNSPTRDSVATVGMSADLQYLERYGMALGLSATTVKQKSTGASSGARKLIQTAYNLSGWERYTPDDLPGVLTLSGEVIVARNNDSSKETGVTTAAAQMAFLDYAKESYLDLGFAYSSYAAGNQGNGALTVMQFTPTIGLAFNEAADWLQFRLYHIIPDNLKRTQNVASTDAVDVKWTHFFDGTGWSPNQIQMGALVGERIYAVEPATVYNFADLQTGGFMLAAQWNFAEEALLIVQGGLDKYDALVPATLDSVSHTTAYSASYLYVGVRKQW
ncbi:MAG: hypothetical protein WC742_11135 [Gallionellaceae bacterium]|jgi:hypothetical protein